MAQQWVGTLKEKTGRSLDEWLKLVRKDGPPAEKECRAWLKGEHGLGTNTAWFIAERAAGKGGEMDDPESYLRAAERYVDAMFAGKAALRPIYDALLKLGLGLGKDVKACPCQTMVPLYGKHVFAQIKPTTNTRVDFGLCLTTYKGKLPKFLVDTGGLAKKDRITHRIELTSPAQIDADLKKWLRAAYDLDS